MKKICVVTGTRAEYGLLRPLIQKIQDNNELELQLVVTGAHLSEEFGYTYREIENDRIPIARKIDMNLTSDSSVAVTESMSIEMTKMALAMEELTPDMMVVLGDRYEILVAATVALIFRIPIAHIHGGEITEGAIDDSIRHAITKMSMLHFTSTEEYRKRVIQLGEQPERVFNVGALGIENIRNVTLLSKEALEESIGFEIKDKTILVTFHPVTLENDTAKEQFSTLLKVIDDNQLRVIFTKANADTNGRVINRMIDEYVSMHSDRTVAFTSLGMLRYLSALQYVTAVVGNSSSGIIEVPSFGIPTVDIGDRQKGRVAANSVIHCEENYDSISRAVEKALTYRGGEKCENPYEGSNTSSDIIDEITGFLSQEISLKKKFFDLAIK